MRYGRDPKPHKGRRRRSGVRIVNARLATTRERSRSPARWIRKLSAGWCAPAPWGHQSPRSGRRSTNSLRHSRRRFEDRHPGRHPGRERRGRFYATPGTPRNRNCRCRRQTAELNPCLAFLASVQIPLSFHVFLTNTMGFVPMQFHEPDPAALKPHAGNSLQLAPSPGTVDLLDPGEVADGLAGGDGLDFLDLADDLETHRLPSPFALPVGAGIVSGSVAVRAAASSLAWAVRALSLLVVSLVRLTSSSNKSGSFPALSICIHRGASLKGQTSSR